MIVQLVTQGHSVKDICQVLKISWSFHYRERRSQDKPANNQKDKKPWQ